MDDEDEVPQFFICPISLQIMSDPVTAVTGITYDRKSIEKWLFRLHNTTCPVTNQALPKNSDLTPNHTLRRLILAWYTARKCIGVRRIPTTLKQPLDKFSVLSLMRDVWLPKMQMETLETMEALALQNETNRMLMLDAGVPNSMVKLIIHCFKINGRNSTTCLEHALRILCLFRNSLLSSDRKTSILLPENELMIDSLIWVLGLDNFKSDKKWNASLMKNNAVLILKTIVQGAKSNTELERLKPEFFITILQVLKEKLSQDGIKAALHVILDSCFLGRNRVKMVEHGAVNELVELELRSTEKRTTELTMGILFHLCSCADGRAQFLSHAAAMAVITKRILNGSPAADDRAVLIISQICRFSGTNGVLQEMLNVGTVTKLCMLMQADCGLHLKHRAREILRAHYDCWKNSPCVELPLLSTYYR